MGRCDVLVICPPGTTSDDYDDAVCDLLEPHCFDDYGGRIDCFFYDAYAGDAHFPVAPGHDPLDEDVFVHAADSLFDPVDPVDPVDHVRGGPLRCLGIEGIRASEAAAARARWDRVASTFTRPPTRLWGHTRAEWEAAARATAIRFEPVVLPDGSWCETGRLGGLARPGDPDQPARHLVDPHTRSEASAVYVERLNAYLDGLPGDSFMVSVRCRD